MTVEQFNKTKFSKDTVVSFRGETYTVSMVDFENKRITYNYKIGDYPAK